MSACLLCFPSSGNELFSIICFVLIYGYIRPTISKHFPSANSLCSRPMSRLLSLPRGCDVSSSGSSDGKAFSGGADEDAEVLRAVVWKCKWMGLGEFAMIPLVYFFAKLHFTQLVYVTVVFHVIWSLVAQVRVRREVADWLCQHVDYSWQEHIAAVNTQKLFCGLLPLGEFLVYFGTLTETLDPALDAWTAANAEVMCTPAVLKKFTLSWRSIPVVGTAIGWIGLPGILLLILCVATVWQLCEFQLKEGDCLEKIKAYEETSSCDPDQDAHRRWHVWINISHLADATWLGQKMTEFGCH